MNKKRIGSVLLAGMILLSGCSLAKEEKEPEKAADRLMGIYAVYSKEGEREHLEENENWIEYGSQKMDSELGELSLPKKILPAEYDAENRTYTFPGTEGFRLFCADVEEKEGKCNIACSDFEDGNFGVTVTNGGTSYDLSGTLYAGEQAENYIWTYYQVYQNEDGLVYLDGSGNSSNGLDFTMTVNEEHKLKTEDGEEVVYTKVSGEIKKVSELQKMLVHQYGEAGQLIETTEIPLKNEDFTIAWNPKAVWAVAEEHYKGHVSRTAYNRSEQGNDPVFHIIYLLNKDGIGQPVRIVF